MSSNEKTAWIHPNPLLSGFVVLPDGYQMNHKEAEERGFIVSEWPASEKVATLYPYSAGDVLLPRGTIVRKDTAIDAGFEIGRQATAKSDPNRDWCVAILRLPDAKDRPSAAAELAASGSPETLSVDQARALLRGLPVETVTTNQPKETPMTETDPRAARLAEISHSMAAFNHSRGYRTPSVQPAARQGAQPVSTKHVEPAKLKRLAEIRLFAMECNGAGRTEEAKRLRLALETNASVGTPLERVFAQLGVDTSKFVPANT